MSSADQFSMSPDNQGAQDALPVPTGDAELVPSYYRQSPFSRAWMRLSQIDNQPIAFFGNYSFQGVPRLPNYTETTLHRLRNKVIQSPDELRGMDTTIWEVRPKAEGDPAEVILLTTPALASAISFDVVACKGDKILHITDPHYAIGDNRTQHVWKLEGEGGPPRPSLADQIKAALGTAEIGLVLVSANSPLD
jgi:hypothetical protein